MKSFIFMLMALVTFCLNLNAERLKVCYITGDDDSVKMDSICDIVISDDEEVEVVALMNTDTKMLTVRFFADYPAVNINVYKNDDIVVSMMRDTKENVNSCFSLSNKGAGLFRIKIAVHQDEDLCGYFEMK